MSRKISVLIPADKYVLFSAKFFELHNCLGNKKPLERLASTLLMLALEKKKWEIPYSLLPEDYRQKDLDTLEYLGWVELEEQNVLLTSDFEKTSFHELEKLLPYMDQNHSSEVGFPVGILMVTVQVPAIQTV